MRLARRASVMALTLLVLCAAVSAQTLRPADDPRNTAPTVGTGGPVGGPTGLFTIYDGQTLRKGEFTFSIAYSNFDRDPGDVDITEVPLSVQIGLSDHLELFFSTEGYRGVKVNNLRNLSGAYLPNTPPGGVSLPAIILNPIRVSGPTPPFGATFRPSGNQPFVQFPFIGGAGPNLGLTGNQIAPPFVSQLGVSPGGNGNFSAASNFPGIGSVFGSILPGIVLTTRTIPPNLTFNTLTVPATFTLAPSYLPDAPFIGRRYGESAFGTFNIGAKVRLTGPENPLGVALVGFYRFYGDSADDANGFNQLQRGASPGGNIGDFGLVGIIDGRLSRSVNVSANFGYILNSNPRSEAMGDAILLDRPDELIAGIGLDFPVTERFQPIIEVKSVHYVGGRTPNAFPNNPVDFLAGFRYYPRRWFGFSGAYRAHMNQQGGRLFRDRGPEDFPPGFIQSSDPHGYLFQFFAGRRNERAPTVVPNNPPTTAVSASPSRVVLAANCGPDQIPAEGCTATSSQVQLAANATDPDGDTLLYTWSTTGGRITGDGANVTWDLSGVQPGTYTASVEVDDGCGCIAFSSTTVTVESCGCVPAPTPTPTPIPTPVETPTPQPTPTPITPTQFDTYGKIARNDEKARLDNFAVALQNDPGAQGYIITYGGRRGPAGEAQTRADFAKNYLVNSRGIDAGRLVTVDGGFREEATTELWLVPGGATPPTATPNVDASEVQTTRPPRRAPRRRGRRDDDE